MRRVFITLVMLAVATAVYARPAPEAARAGAGAEDVAYISPFSSPGIQDRLEIPMTAATTGRRNVVIIAYELEILDSAGREVWSESAVDESERPGFFGRLLQNLGLRERETTVTIPESTFWNGTYRGSALGADGARVPDGEYTFVLTITDSTGAVASSEPRTVVVDNTPPAATATVDHPVFSPNDDGNKDFVTFTQTTSREDQWVGRITRDGRLIYEATWTGNAPREFVWDGRDIANLQVTDGEYLYTLTATDRAGNTGGIEPISLVVDTAPRPLEIHVDNPAFSPNDDGIKDTVTFTFGRPSLLRLESAVLTVQDGTGATIGSVEIGDRIAVGVTLTGYLDDARRQRAPEGTYFVSVTATYGNGTVSRAGPVQIILDVTPPSGYVTVSDRVFSPDGDGFKDTVTITHNLSSDADWTGYVFVPGGPVLETLRLGRQVPRTVVFDGTDFDGNPIPDGTYAYSLIGVDAAGNQFETEPVRVTIDRRPTTVDLLVSREYFSPNGDGHGDYVVVRPVLSVRDGIERYTFRVLDSRGTVVLQGEGTGTPPAETVWDGADAQGRVLPEGAYVGVLDLVYEKGNRPQGVTPVVYIDFTVPSVALRASATQITPNRDGVDDTVTFIPMVDPINEIVRFRGWIEGADGRVIREIAGDRPVGAVVWDGTTATGAIAPVGQYVAALEVEHRNGTIRTARTPSIALGTISDVAPQVVLQLSPQVFSPDGDGRADTVMMVLSVFAANPIASWTINVVDPRGNVFFGRTGRGEPVRSFEWDGRNDAGRVVEMATDYQVVYEITDVAGNVARGSETLTVDILTVERFGMRKIAIDDILFEGYTTRYLNWNPELSDRNARTLDRLAEMLRKFPAHRIELHGHAVSVLYYDAVASDIEHRQTLIPLSEGRARAIIDALRQRGIDPGRIELKWWGKLRPLVPFSDLDGRFVNRRVEFFLVR